MTDAFKEQRAYPRKQLSLGIGVSLDLNHSAQYEMQDYCPRGMLLRFESGSEQLKPCQLQRGNRVIITLSLTFQGQSKTTQYKLKVAIARSFDDFIGVAFNEPNPAILQALDQLASHQSPLTGKTAHLSKQEKATQQQVITHCRQILSTHLIDILHDFFRRANDHLLHCASEANSNEDQAVLYGVIAELSRFRQSITESFHDTVLDGMEALEHPSLIQQKRSIEETDSFELSIIDNEEFESWVLVSAMISKIESNFTNELFELLQRLATLTGSELFNKDNNPLGPAVICRGFCDALKVIHLQTGFSKELHTIFAQVVTPHLARLYQDLAKLLIKAGILPIVEHKPIIIEAVRETIPAASETQNEVTTHPTNDASKTTSRNKSAYQVGLKLLNLQKSTTQQREKGSAAELDYYTSQEVMQALETLPSREGQDIYSDLISNLLQENLHTERLIPDELNNSIKLTANLLKAILSDALLTEVNKQYVEQLKIPLLKLALSDNTFFTDANHPARKLLNQIALLGTTHSRKGEASDINPELMRTITRVSDRVNRQQGDHNEVFAEATEALSPLIRHQTESFNRNVERTIKACKGAHKIQEARRTTRASLSQRMLGIRLPALIFKLLDLGWPKLLVITYLRKGPSSREWRQQLQVIDDLLMLVVGAAKKQTAPTNEMSQILKNIHSNLSYVSFDSIKTDHFVSKLEQLLSNPNLMQQSLQKRAETEQSDIDKFLGYSLEEVTDGHRFGAETNLSCGTQQQQNRWLSQAKTLNCGNWLHLSGLHSDSHLLQLVWRDDESGLHLFVNRKGIKSLTLLLSELAALMMNSLLVLFEEVELPLVERSEHRMLQQMHEQLLLVATHDPLTGLLNRKEFYKQLYHAVQDWRLNKTQYVLCNLDLDQFSVINNSCGHLAGDALLKQIAELLQQHAEKQTLLARLGSDEFGLLFQQCDEQQAFNEVTKLRSVLKDHPFIWEERSYSIRASAGLARISDESVRSLMIAANSARQTAKSDSVNHIQLYQSSNTKLQQQKELTNWAAHIDSVLENNQLRLYCQQIAPLNQTETSKPHYEVLLRVVDAQGKIGEPSGLIHAAELANRMPDIDRWVIQEVFKWLGQNREQLKAIGAFGINLSGNSLNDEHLLPFIKQQFKQTPISPKKVYFEVTETAAIASLSNAADFIKSLKELGCTFALDDFGSGLSSYSYLKHLPVDYIKIDGMFVKDLLSSSTDYAMVKSINELSQYLGKQTIAEYVENQKIYDKLVEMGVNYAQGYGVEKPRELAGLVASSATTPHLTTSE
jgi:diguanylate cyclase (GGDEF)-like protein